MQACMTWQIFIIEDNELVRESYVTLLEFEPDLAVCGQAATAAEALAALPVSGAHAAIIDVSLPDQDGLDLARHLCTTCPDVPLLVISGQDEETHAGRAREAGAVGYVDKKDAATRLLPALRQALAERPAGKNA